MTFVESEAPQEQRNRFSTFSSLRNTDYRYLLVGNLFNMAGLWVQQVTIAWLVWELSYSASVVGVTAGVRFLPFIFMAPLGGIAADRLDRRRLLMITQTVMAVAAVLFAVVVVLGWVRVWHAMVFNFVMGCGFIMNTPVRQSLIANTVPLKDLGNAIALNAMAGNASRIIGPAFGGVLVVALGAAGNFLLQAALYLGMVAIVFPMKVRYRDTAPARRQSAFRSMKEGFRYVWENKTILGLVSLNFIPNLFLMPFMQILPAYTEEVLHANATIYGYLLAAFGIGGFLATLTMASFGGILRSGRLGIMALSASAVFLILFSQSTHLWVAFLLIVAIGFCQMTFKVNNHILVQTLVPDVLRGRIVAIYESDHALIPIAYSLVGVCADAFSIPIAVAASGILGLVLIITLTACVKQIRDLQKL